MVGNETNEITEELFKSLLQRYEEGLEESVKGSEFVFDSDGLLKYKLNKISLNRGGSYIDSPECLKTKKATINTKFNDDNCFQYATIATLNHKQIKIYSERIANLQPFINQYNWKGISFPSHKEDWKKFESDNKSISLNILFVSYNTEKNKTCIQIKT